MVQGERQEAAAVGLGPLGGLARLPWGPEGAETGSCWQAEGQAGCIALHTYSSMTEQPGSN